MTGIKRVKDESDGSTTVTFNVGADVKYSILEASMKLAIYCECLGLDSQTFCDALEEKMKAKKDE